MTCFCVYYSDLSHRISVIGADTHDEAFLGDWLSCMLLVLWTIHPCLSPFKKRHFNLLKYHNSNLVKRRTQCLNPHLLWVDSKLSPSDVPIVHAVLSNHVSLRCVTIQNKTSFLLQFYHNFTFQWWVQKEILRSVTFNSTVNLR